MKHKRFRMGFNPFNKYIIDLLKRVEMLDSKPSSTPVVSGTSLSRHGGDPLPNPMKYRSIVGALQYCTITRPDLSFAVNKVYQFLHAPTTIYLNVVKRILHYLKGTSSHGIFLTPSSFSVKGFTDDDWASCLHDCHSTCGYWTFLGHNLISWSSLNRRQSLVQVSWPC